MPHREKPIISFPEYYSHSSDKGTASKLSVALF